MRYNIAIDGPAGAGKSTIAKRLAKELGAIYVDTGAMYRAMAYYFIQKGVDKDDIDTITKLCKDVEVSISYENGEQQVILNGENITGFIRQEAVGNMASATSVYPVVREKLVELQRQLAARENVVMDGRDIGTVVLPDANVKIFLTASSKVRAKRRFDELTAKGEKCDIDAIEKDIIERDHRDMTRETSPLKQADDAVLLDSSDMTIDEVVDRMKQLVKEAWRMGELTIAKSAGFCFGVTRAVNMVYEAIEKENVPIYTYGPIIHNDEVVKDMEKNGVTVINDLDELSSHEKGVMIIRSHGISKAEYDRIKNCGFEVLNATCPFVSKIHRYVEDYSSKGYDIIIVGSPKHPEVCGIKGWADEKCHVTIINSPEDAENYMKNSTKKLCIVSQTTFNYNKFQDIVEIIAKKGYDITVLNTICNATEVRQTEARKVAQCSDVMIVIGDRHSSNTQKLFEICKNECKNTYYIQTSDEMGYTQIRSNNNVGITAGASTPNNIIEEVSKNVRNEL